MKNKYDVLKAQQKKERDLISKKTTTIDNKIAKYSRRIQKLKYEKQLYCRLHNDKIIDLTDLIENEVQRINRDAEVE